MLYKTNKNILKKCKQENSNRRLIEKKTNCVARPVRILYMPLKRDIQLQDKSPNSGHQIPWANNS